MAYGSEATCDSCGAHNEYGTIDVGLPLPAESHTHYFCAICSVTVKIPVAVENRFLLALDEQQTDQFGNPSWYRSELARILKPYGKADRPYALVRIPRLELICPEHKRPLDLWSDYPSARLLICRECGEQSVLTDGVTWFSGSAVAPW